MDQWGKVRSRPQGWVAFVCHFQTAALPRFLEVFLSKESASGIKQVNQMAAALLDLARDYVPASQQLGRICSGLGLDIHKFSISTIGQQRTEWVAGGG
jgi:hypothetical protein